jgi:type IV secretory pathway VirB10-like protein
MVVATPAKPAAVMNFKTGTVIVGVMVSGINSDLPGSLIA